MQLLPLEHRRAPPLFHRLRISWRCPPALVVLLVLAGCLRIVLVIRGGQRYFPDEQRYFRASNLLLELVNGDFTGALRSLVVAPDHNGFTLVGLGPAFGQYLALGLFRQSRTLALAAILLSLSSVAAIALTYVASRRAGGDRREGLTAAFLMVCSTTMAYFSRHLVPYDVSMFLALASLCVGLTPVTSYWRSITCGLLAGFAFLTYNGYWTLCLVVLAAHVFWGTRAHWARRAAGAGLGFAIWPLLLTLASFRFETSYFESMAKFGRTVSQCDYGEGWSAPWAYLWYAEHGVLIFWAAGSLLVLYTLLARVGPARSRGALWLSMATAVYILLVVGSVGLHAFCTYGRISRQLVPFLCLTAAYAATLLMKFRWFRWAQWAFVAALALQAAFNLRQPLAQRFPGEVLKEVRREYERLGYDTTLEGAYQGRNPGRRWILLNTRYLTGITGLRDPPAGDVVFRIPHPLEFIPYQYESLTPKERSILRSADISIRLIDTRSAKNRAIQR
jgi:hypothetical protein